MKVGVLVVAYNAETTLVDVLDRIQPDMRRQLAEVLVQDDHSTDDTFAVATDYLQRGTDLPLTVVRHPQNLGYGGNQKAGYTYAINHGWDVVVLLHGDGQYAPEVMHEMVAPIVDGDADAVFGSRMLTKGAAREGGMPAYKFVGNRILTGFQNRMTGLRLSEWHSGYRAYRVSALAELPFVGNSDDFDFDTEIILQLHAASKRIVEIPIPTFYGDEICRVNGIAYARDITLDTLRHRFGKTGLGDGRLGHRTEAELLKPSPHSAQGRILQMMDGRPSQRVLDMRCGSGLLAMSLAAQGHQVTGVDRSPADGLEPRLAGFVAADVDAPLPDEIGGGYDVIVADDVVEEVRDPKRLLTELAELVRPGGTIIATVPNIGHWYVRSRMLLGLFDYDQRGILDKAHLRFFTRRSFARLARQAGLETVGRRHTGLPLDQLVVGDAPWFRRSIGVVDRALVRLWPTLFAYQFVYELTPWRAGALRLDRAGTVSPADAAITADPSTASPTPST